MSVRVTGQEKLIAELEKRFGKTAMQQVSDRALKAGAEVFVKELKVQLATFKDTGATIREVTISEPFTQAGARTVKVHWRGPDNRYRIIHLNEWGTIKNPRPRGKGKIALALRNAEKVYREAIKKAIREGI